MNDADTIRLDRPVPGVLVATLNRPERMNALTFGMFDQLQRLCDDAAADDTVRAVILTGTGRGFCAGLDLDDAATLAAMTAAEFLSGQEQWAKASPPSDAFPSPSSPP
jgi:enoyl-CoA hydratase